MAGDRILAIDVGTQSVRAMVFDPLGTLEAIAKVPIEPYVPGPPGCCEQDADLYWRAIGEACRRLWTMPGVRRDALAGVALTTQRGTVVVTDERGEPLRRAMVWLDRCRAEGLPRIGGKWGLAFKAAGATETVATFMAEAEANVLAREEPELWRRVRHYLLLSGFLTHRLTGQFVDSVASQVGYLPFDYKRLAWAAEGDWRWQAVPVRREWLPELVPPGAALGHDLGQRAAEATGIPAGLPLIAAAGDKACEVLGSGALEPHIGAISLGTTASVNTTHRRYVEVIPIVPPYPAAVPGAYSLEVQVYRGYWMIEWFKREFGAAEVTRAAAMGAEPETLFDDLLAGDAAGRDGPRPPAVLVARRADPGTRGEGRRHRLGRRPHAGPPVPGHPRGPRLRAPRGRRADGRSGPACRSPSCGCRAAGHRARPPCSSPRTSSACRPRVPTRTRRPASARRSTRPWASGCTRRSRPRSRP